MDRQEDILSQVWSVLAKKRQCGVHIDLFEFAKAFKEVQPDFNYAEYKLLMSSYPNMLSKTDELAFIPNGFECFVKSFLAATHPSRVLVPFATSLECDWLDDKTTTEYHFPDKILEKTATMFADIKTIEEIPEQGVYDLIFAALPLGMINDKSISCQITERSSQLLSDEGYCVFTFAKSIAMSTADKWLCKLEREGLYCVAIVDLPTGAYAPMTMVDSEIVVFSKRKAEKRFVGLLSEEDFAEKIVANFIKRKASTSGAKLGLYVEGEIRCYSDYLRRSRIQNKTKTLTKAYNGKPLMIKQIGSVHAPNKNNEFQESDNAVYIPKLGKSPVVTSISDFHIKAQNYFQIVVDPEMILPRFLAFFFNTEEGVNLRQLWYRDATIPAFNTKIIGDLIVPCPTLKLQSEYLKTYDQLENLRVDIETLKDRLQKTPASYKNIRKEIKDINNTGDKFVQWIETLPYPIATILKKYSVTEEPSKKQEILFYFYEAYAIFLATILSAALNKSLVDCSKLNSVDSSRFEKASFGNWVWMDRALSNLFLEGINSQDVDTRRTTLECFKTADENLISLFCNKKACNILEKACDYRNSWKGHAGITSETLYKDHVDTLDSMLHNLHESIKDLYERVRLIRPFSLSYSKGIFSNKVEVLTGSNSIFTMDTIKALTPLDNSKLYLQLIDTGEVLELPPYFILKNSPVDAKNACYFYNRVEKGNTKYVSYHYEGRPEDIEAGKTAFDHIKQILSV